MNKLSEVARPGPVSEPAQVQVDDEIDLGRLLLTFWSGKWVVAAFMLAAVLIGGWYAFVAATPLYTSTAVVAMDAREQRVITDIESVLGGGGPTSETLATEALVLRSRGLVGRLVDERELTSDPEFNATLRTPSAFSPGAMIEALKSALGGEDPAPPSAAAVRNRTIDAVIDHIGVEAPRGALVFEISLTTEDPDKSALLANALADLYIRNQIEVKFEAHERATEFLSERAADLQQTLEQSERALNDFREAAELVSPEALVARSRQIKDLRDRIESQKTVAEDALQRLERLRALREAGDFAALAEETNDPVLRRSLSAQAGGTPQGSTIVRLADGIVARAETNAERQQTQLEALRASAEQLGAELDRQSSELIRLQQMQREVEATRLLYESFLARLKETDVQRGLQQADSRLISEAVPRAAASPKKALILVLSGVLGMMIGAGYVLWREMMRNSFRTATDLRDGTGHVVMGTIPLIPGKHRKETFAYLRDKPTSIVAEAVRNLRTSLLMSNLDRAPQVIMITSSVSGEGKTTISLGLALNMSALGKRVLLIEGDIRRRTFARYFDVSQSLTLIEAMEDHSVLDRGGLRKDDVGVDLLTGTRVSINAADLFASQSFADFMASAREHYDYILIDTPPVLVVPDARVIGPHADAILYVVHWNKTSRTQVSEGLRMFATAGLRVAGLALSQIDPEGMRNYGYRGQYGYDSYGSKYYDT